MQSEPQMNFFFWFGLFLFRSPLLQESSFLSFPVGTQMFQFPTFPSIHYFTHVQITDLFPSVEFPHSEIHGYNGYLLLPVAFRSLSRLSSALGTQAFSLRSQQLNILFLILILTSCLVYLISSIYFSMCFLENSKLCIAVSNFVIIFSIYTSIISKILPCFPCTTCL